MSALATIDTYLLDGGLATAVKTFTVPLIDIKDFPDLEGEQEEIDVTTLSDAARVFAEGVQGNAAWTFTCNYTKAGYEALAALAGLHKHYAVFLGTLSGANASGADGMFVTTGYLSVRKSGGGVNDPHDMAVKILLTSDVIPYYLPTLVGVTESSPKVGVATTLTLNYVGVPTAPTLAYQWKLATTETGSYSDISGATSAAYTPVSGDATKWLECVVTATGTATGVITSTPRVVAAA